MAMFTLLTVELLLFIAVVLAYSRLRKRNCLPFVLIRDITVYLTPTTKDFQTLEESCVGPNGKKNKKFEGAKDEKYLRQGKWVFFSEGGAELSITFYTHGLKDGFTMVKYPSGRMHYRGEYHNDKIVGLWTTYDESGKITSEKDYGYLEK